MSQTTKGPEIDTRMDVGNGKLIDYQGEDEKAYSDRQVAFERVLEKGRYGRPTAYKSAAVLTLTWDNEHDNLSVQSEVQNLKNVLEDEYNFRVTSATIQCGERKDVQVKVNRIMAEWVDENDDPRNLLIVYYAGHGMPGKSNNDLIMYNRSRVRQSDVYSFIWNDVERFVEAAMADVLLIFDCCHAGDLRGPSKAFEYLAATEAGKTTPAPGPTSFTTALISSLKELSKAGKPFTIPQLANKIVMTPKFPPGQKPVLSSRVTNGAVGRIMLFPASSVDKTPSKSEETESPISPSAPPLARDGKILTIHLDLTAIPSRESVEAFGHLLNHANEISELGVVRVRWGALRPTLIHHIAEAFSSGRGNGIKSRWAAIRGVLPVSITLRQAQSSGASQSGNIDPPANAQADSSRDPQGFETPGIKRSFTLPIPAVLSQLQHKLSHKPSICNKSGKSRMAEKPPKEEGWDEE